MADNTFLANQIAELTALITQGGFVLVVDSISSTSEAGKGAFTYIGKSTLEFANSLIKQFHEKGYLTGGQIPYVEKLINQIKKSAEKEMAGGPKQVTLGNFSGVVDLLKGAQVHLKKPKIHLLIEGQPVVLSLAGPKSKYPGHVWVAGAGKYPNNKYYGRVSPEGVFSVSTKAEEAHFVDKIVDLLVDLVKDPAGVAKEHGKLTGNCCFCNKTLTDPHSVGAGFGPICAAHYGLTSKWEAAAGVSQDVGISAEKKGKKSAKKTLSETIEKQLGKNDAALKALAKEFQEYGNETPPKMSLPDVMKSLNEMTMTYTYSPDSAEPKVPLHDLEVDPIWETGQIEFCYLCGNFCELDPAPQKIEDHLVCQNCAKELEEA